MCVCVSVHVLSLPLNYTDAVPASQPTEKRSTKLRNIVGFWLLGFCIDYAYFIMLSAAFDIIHSFEDTPSGWSNATNGSGFDQCMRDVNGSWPGREPCEKESTSVSQITNRYM